MKLIDAEQFGNEKLRVVGLGRWRLSVIPRKVMKFAQQILEGTKDKQELVGLCMQDAKRVVLNAHFVKISTTVRVKKVILHEIAHAIHGTENGHDKAFRKLAKALGGYVNGCA